MKPTVLVISCEHAVNTAPPKYRHLFKQNEAILHTARASDLGALEITTYLCNTLNCECTHTNVSRLLIDCNRSLAHSRCFSKYTNALSKTEKNALIEEYYLPFREKTKALIDQHTANNEQVLHLSVHTFVPILKGLIQNTGIGILYDSDRHGEKEVARQWHGLLLQEPPAYRVRMNYPFSGRSDSFTASLRKDYAEKDYLGIEVEINQALFTDDTEKELLLNALSHSLSELLALL